MEEQVNKLTLSKQDAEGQLNILRPEYNRLQERIKELEEGIEKHKLYIWGDGIVDHPADEELYNLIEKKEPNPAPSSEDYWWEKEKPWKCTFYDDWDYTCKIGGDLCLGDEFNYESCDTYMEANANKKKETP